MPELVLIDVGAEEWFGGCRVYWYPSSYRCIRFWLIGSGSFAGNYVRFKVWTA